MTDLQSRLELWRQPVQRVAVAGATGSSLPESTLASLRAEPVHLIQQPLREASSQIAADVADADVLVTGGAALDAAAFAQLRRVRFILRPYVGYDDVDVQAATDAGILFANVPDTFIEEVANHTLALILAGNRLLFQNDAWMRRGEWSAGGNPRRSVAQPIRRPSAQTLGLVGFGNIARLVVERARPFGYRLLASDPYVSADQAAAVGVELVSLDRLLAEADVISIHVFLSAETRHLIDAKRLALVKPGAYLVNTSRGPVIDEPALIEALRSGRLAGAGLDVFETEPIQADNPLLTMDNVIVTPHVASFSQEGQVRHNARIADIVLRVIRGELPERKVVVNKDLYDRVEAALGAAPAAR